MINVFKIISNGFLRKIKHRSPQKIYNKRFEENAFVNGEYKNQQQYEAQIIKMYHSVEKGLSYKNFRAGFGRQNIDDLIRALESYAEQYDIEAFFYKTALSVLNEYVCKNEAYGLIDKELKERIEKLPGIPNEHGGTIQIRPCNEAVYKSYEEFVLSRHSVREFSADSVNLDVIKESIALAQHTPSACNRQGWKTRIIVNKDAIKTILAN